MSGSTIGGVVGGIIGFYFGGPAGAQVGWMIGSAVGGYVDPDVIKGPKLTDPQQQTSAEGVPRPVIYGTAAVMGNVIQVQGKPTQHKKRERTGKGGPVQETYTYTRTAAIRICEAAPLGGEMKLRRAWVNGKLAIDRTGSGTIDGESAKLLGQITFYSGSETQLPDPDLEALPASDGGGVGNVPAYRGTCYAVLRNADVTQSRGPLPQILWEVSSEATETDCEDLYSDALYYFPLNDASSEGTAIETQQGLNGVYSTGVSGGPALRIGSTGSLHLSELEDYMVADHPDSFRLGAENGWTVSVWCRPTEDATGDVSVFNNIATLWASTLGGQRNYSFSIASINDPQPGRLFFSWNTDGTNAEYLSNDSVASVGVTKFLMMTYEPVGPTLGITRFYVDGNKVDEIESTPQDWGGRWLACGGYAFPSSYGFIGYVSDLACWDRQFTDEEAAAAYISANYYYPAPDADGVYVSEDGAIYTECSHTVTPGSVFLSDVVANLCERCDAFDYDVSALSTIEVRGLAITQPVDGAGAIQELQKVYLFDLTEWGNSGELGTKLRAVLRGGPILQTITDDDLVESDDDETVRKQQVEFPRKVTLFAPDPDANYEATPQPAERESENVKATGEISISTAVVMTRDEKARLVDISHKVLWEQALGTVKLELPSEFSALVPSDAISYGSRRYVLEKVTFGDGTLVIEGTRDRASAYSSIATGNPTVPLPNPVSGILGPTLATIFNAVRLRTQDDTPGMYVSVCGLTPAWSGCDLYLSVDGGASEQLVATIIDPGIMGYLTADLPIGGDPLSVKLYSDDELDDATDAQLAARLNAAAVVKNDLAEILQFKTATDTGEREYDLGTPLYRGLIGSAEVDHDQGADFVALSGGFIFLPIDIANAGKTLIFRPVTRGTVPENNETVSVVYLPQFTSPADIEFLLDETGDNLLDETGAYLLE